MTDEEKRLAENAQKRDYYHNWGGSEYSKRYYFEHFEEISAYQKAYREVPEHREKMREYQKRYLAAHRDEINARRRNNYRSNHKRNAELREKKREYQKRYYAEHCDELREYHKRYCAEHREELNARKREKYRMKCILAWQKSGKESES